jgi:hypothetical protein
MINIVARSATLGALLGVLFTLVLLIGHQVHSNQATAQPRATVTGPAHRQPDGDDQWV